MPDWLNELTAWWAALPPEWVFLALLPLLVGAVGLLVDWGAPGEKAPARAAPVRRRHHHRHRGSH